MKPSDISDWNVALLRRTRAFRDRAGFEQQQMAALLGITKEQYRKYEGPPGPDGRATVIPPHLIPQFCRACHIDYEDLFDTKVRSKPPRKRQRRLSQNG